MKKNIIAAALLISFGHVVLHTKDRFEQFRVLKNREPWIHMSFFDGMRPDLHPKSIARSLETFGVDGPKLYHFFRTLYEKNNPSVVMPQEEVKIPKIIHQVWIGGKVPAVFKPLMQTWIDAHVGRGWEYKLWTDEDMKDYPLYNREFYDATDSAGVKSDIAKWEIIYDFGGVYIDMDHECLRTLDILHHTYDFYTCLQPLDAFFIQLGAGLFAAKPKHPILKHCIETIKDDWHHKGAPKKTGPIHFTKSFIQTAGTVGGVVAALPAYYMYPLGAQEKKIDYDTWINRGAFAIHWWAKSWMPEKYRAPAFRNLKNDKAAESWND